MKINEVQRSRPSGALSQARGEPSLGEQERPDQVQLGAEPGVYRYGQKSEPPSASLQQKARWHYERASALKHQAATHAPFHFAELGQEKEPEVSSKPRRAMLPVARYLPTQFYPGGEGERPALNPVAGVGAVQLQRIIPRYELSTAETRESGLGPSLELPPQAARPPVTSRAGQGEEAS